MSPEQRNEATFSVASFQGQLFCFALPPFNHSTVSVPAQELQDEITSLTLKLQIAESWSTPEKSLTWQIGAAACSQIQSVDNISESTSPNRPISGPCYYLRTPYQIVISSPLARVYTIRFVVIRFPNVIYIRHHPQQVKSPPSWTRFLASYQDALVIAGCEG